MKLRFPSIVIPAFDVELEGYEPPVDPGEPTEPEEPTEPTPPDGELAPGWEAFRTIPTLSIPEVALVNDNIVQIPVTVSGNPGRPCLVCVEAPEDDGRIFRWMPGEAGTQYIPFDYDKVKDRKSITLRCLGFSDDLRWSPVRVSLENMPPIPTVNDLAAPVFLPRLLKTLSVDGRSLKGRVTPENFRAHDSGYIGNDGVATSRAPHGNWYPNQGLEPYLNEDAFPGIAHEPVGVKDGLIRLYATTFSQPKTATFRGRMGTQTFDGQSAMIEYSQAPEMCGKNGLWICEAKLPSRQSTFPAIWHIPLGTRSQNPDHWSWHGRWSHEIDAMELFNFKPSWPDHGWQLNVAQHYRRDGTNENSTTDNLGMWFNIKDWLASGGHPTTKGSLWEDFHEYATEVTPDWITHYIDGVEYSTMRRAAPEYELFPIYNVALKLFQMTPDEFSRAPGTTDMLIKRIEFYE